MEKYSLAIVGATGLVGQKLLKVLEEENLLDKFNITMFVSEKSAGQEICFNGLTYKLKLLEKKSIEHFDFAIFSSGDEVSREYAEKFAQVGAYVIDNSNAFRRENDIPLVVPEINSQLITRETKIIANPNCSTIQLVLVLDRLKKLAKIKSVRVSTYQSVSGAGAKALLDLQNNTNFEIKEGINGNAVASIGSFDADGFCKEEDKIMFESKKILNEDFDIFASTVRIPIPYCHLESVFVEFENDIDFERIEGLFDGKTICYSKNIVLPSEVADTNKTFVFRFRRCSSNEIAFFVLSDNLRRGASFNAVLILKKLLHLLHK